MPPKNVPTLRVNLRVIISSLYTPGDVRANTRLLQG